MKCRKCGGHVTAWVENRSRTTDTYKEYCNGTCTNCHTEYYWTRVFTYTEDEEVEEV